MKYILLHKIIPLLMMVISLSSSGFYPVSSGKVLWMSNSANGDYVLVTHHFKYSYDYVEIVSSINGEYSSIQDMLPGTPTEFAVSGCGNYVTIAASIDNDIYIDSVKVPNNIACNVYGTVYIPIVGR